MNNEQEKVLRHDMKYKLKNALVHAILDAEASCAVAALAFTLRVVNSAWS